MKTRGLPARHRLTEWLEKATPERLRMKREQEDRTVAQEARSLPLSGIRVIDLTSVVMGPYASQMLGDFGADVIKIEAPEGDSTRYTGPATEHGMAAVFLGVNRNKRSVVLDLKRPEAQAALLKLIGTADVFMHSIRPQKLAPLGLAPNALMARHPKLIFAGLHGFTERGPYGGRPAYDDIIQGMSGLAALMQHQGGEPRYFPTIAADKTSGLFASNAILAALMLRERTGQGGFVEIPMFESMVAFNLVEHLYGGHFDPPLAPPGYPRVLDRWRRPYRTADGFICMMPYTNQHWRQFFAEAGQPALADDPRFTDIASRTRNIGMLYETTGRFVAGRSTAAWLEACERLQIPAAPMRQLEELPSDPHLEAIGFFSEHEDAGLGRVRFPGVPVQMNRQPFAIAIPPRLGEHTREILEEIGLAKGEVDALLRQSEPRGAGALPAMAEQQ
ncbi:MAG: Formyl-CoA transferase [Microvirga sp.]|jgi:crotonobetainyl-CoA:carnitine CoA-transferase CaiB-like acyl-CoA transferase|nr:Formyl-CoA transferase [Microvirga sp.]